MSLSHEHWRRALRLALSTRRHLDTGSQPIPWSTDEQYLMANLIIAAAPAMGMPIIEQQRHDHSFNDVAIVDDPHDHDAEIESADDELARLRTANGTLAMSPEYERILRTVAHADADALVEAEKSYGTSWKERGGIGAFMMLARKWDRLQVRVKAMGWDVFRAIKEDTRREGAIDDVRDLRRYLMLVETDCNISHQVRAASHNALWKAIRTPEEKIGTQAYVDAVNAEIAKLCAVTEGPHNG